MRPFDQVVFNVTPETTKQYLAAFGNLIKSTKIAVFDTIPTGDRDDKTHKN